MKTVEILKDCRWAVNFKGVDFKAGEVVHVSDVRAADEMIAEGFAKHFDGKAEDVKTSDDLHAEQNADENDAKPGEEKAPLETKDVKPESDADRKKREKAEEKARKQAEKDGKK